MSLETVVIKKEPEWEDEGVSETRASLYPGHAVKEEFVRPEQALNAFPARVCVISENVKLEIKVELEDQPNVTTEPVGVKTEPVHFDNLEHGSIGQPGVHTSGTCGSKWALLCTKNKIYVCDTCDKQFERKLRLIKHIQIHQDRHFCKKCRRHYSSESKFVTHNCKRRCKTCNKLFKYKWSLEIHERIHYDGDPLRCKVCGKLYKSSSHLAIHEQIHKGNKPYSCRICNKRFGCTSNLRCHLLTCHSGKKPYQCKICHKRFTIKTRLNTHKWVHSGLKRFSCKFCDMRFTTKHSSQSHERKHARDKKLEINTQQIYICEICKMQFNEASVYRHHKKIHAGEGLAKGIIKMCNVATYERVRKGAFSCDICQKQFSKEFLLTQHVQLLHAS